MWVFLIIDIRVWCVVAAYVIIDNRARFMVMIYIYTLWLTVVWGVRLYYLLMTDCRAICMITSYTLHLLTHWGQDKMVAIFQTTSSNVFPWMKMYRFVRKGPINNIPSFVLTMARRRPDDKPLSEPMMITVLTHIWVTWPQCITLGKCIVVTFTIWSFILKSVVFQSLW